MSLLRSLLSQGRSVHLDVALATHLAAKRKFVDWELEARTVFGPGRDMAPVDPDSFGREWLVNRAGGGQPVAAVLLRVELQGAVVSMVIDVRPSRLLN